jgi:CRISPR-associated protein Cas1
VRASIWGAWGNFAMKNLRVLPKVRDSLTYLYVEHCRIDQDAKAIAIHDVQGKTPVPCASLTLLMLGPGTTITHAAIRTLADNGCLVAWTGEEGVRMYAIGQGETRYARNVLRQAWLVSHRALRLGVVMQLYRMRFQESLDDSLTLEQIRGMEGVRVRQGYARASAETGVPWAGRSYRREKWNSADPVNRALSAANSCLYGICHAAIVSAGYSPALGFIHTGKMLSFVYDVADLYKTEVTIPVAFHVVREGVHDLESRVRRACRDSFRAARLLQRIVPDLERALGATDKRTDYDFDSDEAAPGSLWDDQHGEVTGGVNRAPEKPDTSAEDKKPDSDDPDSEPEN